MAAISLNRFRRMPFAAKVHSLNAEIGGDQGFMLGREAQHGAIVTDSRHG
jgi:hypothetical protein